ncbi:hypothetical protein AKI39_24390 [Bordetella sp. H567]|uniref:hypothetical protein n=1 Tax=Bordetella sp. H567 TaxID=1697043 RepID=UPI00081C4C9C|nr:hypothetical protein [Bordetella sp. H567]AOB33221.1 hypothetical protein AKI39_24390 [Bordetella sp. H567]
MVEVQTGITAPVQALAVADAEAGAKRESIAAATSLAALAGAYQAFTAVPRGKQPPASFDIPIRDEAASAMGAHRARRSADAGSAPVATGGADRGSGLPSAADESASDYTMRMPAAATVSGEFAAGVPVADDFSVAVPPLIARTESPAALSCAATHHTRAPGCAWFDRLDGYVATPRQAGDRAKAAAPDGGVSKARIDWGEIFAILGGKDPRIGVTPYRLQRSARDAQATVPASREPVVGALLTPDFGVELIRVFRSSELSTWQRADAISRVLQEWAEEGPSARAGERLRKLFEPAYIHTPDEPAGAIVVDAVLLHLMDRGRYPELVRGHIESLKRSGDYEPLVQALRRHYPDKDVAWAEGTVDKLLGSWSPSLTDASASGDGESIPPGIDLDTRLRKFHQLMNPDYRPGQGKPVIRRHGSADEDSVRQARPDGPIRYA